MSYEDQAIERWQLPGTIFFGFLFWILGCSVVQDGWEGFKAFWVLYGLLVLLILMLVILVGVLRSGPVDFLVFAFAALGALWIFFAGPRLMDGIAVGIAGFANFFLMRWFARRNQPGAESWMAAAPPRLKYLGIASFGLLAWILVSLIAVAMTPSLATHPERFARLAQQQDPRWKDLKIGLALSGGGYRAAVFHAGALQALEKLGIRVSHLSTVSGGSVIGAYYAVGGEPARFTEAVAAGQFNLKRRLLLLHNAIRLLTPMRVPGLDVELFPWYRFDRLSTQQALLEDLLFSRAKLSGGLKAGEPELGQPKLMMAVTDLSYGWQLGLLPEGMLLFGDRRARFLAGNDFRPARKLSLTERVALSGAFPIAFPSRSLSGQFQGRSRVFQLVDGGIRDNTGFELLRLADRFAASEKNGLGIEPQAVSGLAGWDLDAILVSDAGAVVEVVDDLGPIALLPRLFDVSAIGKIPEAERMNSSKSTCLQPVQSPLRLTAAGLFARPEELFVRGIPSRDTNAAWDVYLQPEDYPEKVRRELLALLPQAQRERAEKIWRPDGAEELGRMFRRAFQDDFEVFRRASTLDDTLDADVVRTVERLGQLLVFYQWPSLERELETARQCRDRQPGG